MTTPILPTVHLNGTGLKTLKESYDRVDDALYELQQAWGEVEFNARDYYPQGPEAWDQATKERGQHSKALLDLGVYLTAIREHLHSIDQ